MKKSSPYEAVAAVLAILGAFILIGVYMPLINPGFTRVETRHGPPSLGYYLVTTPIPLTILAASWYFNRKARELKPKEKTEENGKKLKWILFAFVVLIVLYAFLW